MRIHTSLRKDSRRQKTSEPKEQKMEMEMKHIAMMNHREAERIIQNQSIPVKTEQIELSEALGRYLSESVVSPIDSPPFSKAAMDGFAVFDGESNTPGTRWKVLETIAAGDVPEKKLRKGFCARIMTGAMVPEGTGRIHRIEYTRTYAASDKNAGNTAAGEIVEVITAEKGSNLIMKGENTHAGAVILNPTRLQAKEIGILAASGTGMISVNRRLTVATVTTGSELREPGEPLASGQIYNSNKYQLGAQIEECGCKLNSLGTVADSAEAHREYLEMGLNGSDILIITGGVSMGDFDLVPGVLEELGADILFHGLKIKPGKPLLFGRKSNTLVFGMPGNPVSSFVLFEIYVKPLIYSLNRIPYQPRLLNAELSESISRRDVERHEFRPVSLRNVKGETFVDPLQYHGSAHLNGLRDADGLMEIPSGITGYEKGAKIAVRLL